MKKSITTFLFLFLSSFFSANLSYAVPQIINNVKVIEGSGDRYSPSSGIPFCSGAGFPKKAPDNQGTGSEDNGSGGSSATANCIDPAPVQPAIINSGFLRSGTPGCKTANCNPTRCFNPNGTISCFVPGAPHGGIDYKAPRGTPLYATMDGIYSLGGTGTVNVSNTDFGIIAQYFHLYCMVDGLKSGQKVSKGDLVGFSGNTGESTGPHLHIQFKKINKNGDITSGPINPLDTKENPAFCPPSPELCLRDNGIQLGTDTSLRVCNSNEMVTGNPSAGGGAAGGGGAGGNNQGTASKTGDKTCDINQYRDVFKTCLFCNLFKVVFNAASTIAELSYQRLAPSIANLLTIGLAIWIALKLLPILAAIKAVNATEFLKEIIEKSFLVFIAIFFLKTSLGGNGSFFAYTLEPIFNTGFKLAKIIMNNPNECTNNYGILEGGGLPASMGNSIVCTIEQLQSKISEVIALGSTSICISLYIKSLMNIPLFFNISYMITGIFLWAGGLLVLIIFPFLLLDSVMQLCVASALLPMAIAAFCFKSTKSYATKVWDTFLATIFNFIFLSLVITILVTAIEVTINDSMQPSEDVMGWILEQLGWEGTLFLKICFVLLLSWCVLEEVASFAQSFGGGSGTSSSIGRGIGGVMASGIGNTAKRALIKPLAKAAGAGAKRLATSYDRMRTQQKANKMRRQFSEMEKTGKNPRKFTLNKDADGNITKTQIKRGKIISTTTGYDADGKSTLSKEVIKISAADRKAERRLLEAKERGTKTINEDGSSTYTYENRYGRSFAVTENTDGTIDYNYNNFLGKDINKKRDINANGGTKTFQAMDRKITQTFDSAGNMIGEQVKMIGANSQDLLGKFGTLKGSAVERINKNKIALETRLNQEPDPLKKAAIAQSLTLETERVNTILLNSVIAERMPGFNKDRSFVDKKQISHVDEHGNTHITTTEIKADGSTETYSIIVHTNGQIMSSHEKIINGKSTKHESDGIIQKKTISENGKSKSVYAAADKSRLNNTNSISKRTAILEQDLQNSLFGEKDQNRFKSQILQATAEKKSLLEMKAFRGAKTHEIYRGPKANTYQTQEPEIPQATAQQEASPTNNANEPIQTTPPPPPANPQNEPEARTADEQEIERAQQERQEQDFNEYLQNTIHGMDHNEMSFLAMTLRHEENLIQMELAQQSKSHELLEKFKKESNDRLKEQSEKHFNQIFGANDPNLESLKQEEMLRIQQQNIFIDKELAALKNKNAAKLKTSEKDLRAEAKAKILNKYHERSIQKQQRFLEQQQEEEHQQAQKDAQAQKKAEDFARLIEQSMAEAKTLHLITRFDKDGQEYYAQQIAKAKDNNTYKIQIDEQGYSYSTNALGDSNIESASINTEELSVSDKRLYNKIEAYVKDNRDATAVASQEWLNSQIGSASEHLTVAESTKIKKEFIEIKKAEYINKILSNEKVDINSKLEKYEKYTTAEELVERAEAQANRQRSNHELYEEELLEHERQRELRSKEQAEANKNIISNLGAKFGL